MKGMETQLVKGEGIAGSLTQVPKKASKMSMKKKRKMRAQDRTQGMKSQFSILEENNLSSSSTGKADIKRVDSFVKSEEKEAIEEGQSNRDGQENVHQKVPRQKKSKKSFFADLKIKSEKMELTPLLSQETLGRTSHRDGRTLYVRFPPPLALRDKAYLESMVPSAVDIRFPRLAAGCSAKFCYIEFETEGETTRMKENLSNIKINGEAFYADYVGKKSEQYNDKEPRIVDPLRLYVGGLPKGLQVRDIKAAFPTSDGVLYKKARNKVTASHAYVLFKTREKALHTFNASKGLKIHGKEVLVMFATCKNNTSKNEEQSAGPAAKKLKTRGVRLEEGNKGGRNIKME